MQDNSNVKANKKQLKPLSETLGNIKKGGVNAAAKAKELAVGSQKAVVDALDVNGDGQIDIEDIIILGIRTPGININREKFLRKEFLKHFPEETIEKAIATTPAKVGIPREKIDQLADDVIKFERNCVSGISAALGAPGGVAMVATIPADITQYYGYMLRATQKLLYLYGFQQIDTDETEGTFDSATMNTLILCLGAMYGVAGANNALKAMAKALASGVSKKFMKAAVTKGVLYPIVKSVCKWFGVNLTKKMCVNFFNKAIPLVGGVVGGALTFATFKPCCDRLKVSLQDTLLSNPDHVSTDEENELVEEIIDVDCVEITDIQDDTN